MVNEIIEKEVCDYYGTTLKDAMNAQIHTRRATEARYFIWYFLRYYHRYPVIMLAEIYGFSRRQVHCGITFIRDAIRVQKPFIMKAIDLRKRLGYGEVAVSENKRLYERRDTIIKREAAQQ